MRKKGLRMRRVLVRTACENVPPPDGPRLFRAVRFPVGSVPFSFWLCHFLCRLHFFYFTECGKYHASASERAHNTYRSLFFFWGQLRILQFLFYFFLHL